MGAPRRPSLDLLRGFVAVGRRMSITLAAKDLFLTQSALSRQVQALEEQLGAPLFARGYRAISFTAEGERLYRAAAPALRQLDEALDELTLRHASRPVTVSTTIGFTVLWLMPRLAAFQAAHPHVDLRVSAHNTVMDLRGAGIDLAIRYAPAGNVPPDATQLFPETVVPVASPALGLAALEAPGAFEGTALLEFEEPRYPWLQWQHWLDAQGWTDARPRAMLHFNQYDLVIQAALAGQGVALGRRALLAPLLESGQLVALAPATGGDAGGYGYWLLGADRTPRPEVETVRAWILDEAARQQATEDHDDA
jgi:LysR family glycine cleavage system transcriptional activator